MNRAEKIKKTLHHIELDLIGELVTLPPTELIEYKDKSYYIKLMHRVSKVFNKTFDLVREMENEIESLKAR